MHAIIGFRRIVLASCAALTLVATNPNAHAVVVGFEQIDWGDGNGGFISQDSDWGQLEIELDGSDTGFLTPDGVGGYYSFINVVTDTSSFGGTSANWAIQNFVIYFNDFSDLVGSLPKQVDFDLGTSLGTDVTSLNYEITFTSAPLSLQPSGSPTPIAVVNSYETIGLQGGEFETGSPAEQEASNYVGAPAGTGVARGGSISTTQSNVPAIDEALNGCAPGSAARSAAYLAGMFPGIVVTNQTPQQIYGAMTNTMNSSTGNGSSGTLMTSNNVATAGNFARGKDAYFSSNGMPIASTTFSNTPLYGGFFGNNGSNAFLGAMSSLNSTGDVEVWITWGFRFVQTNFPNNPPLGTNVYFGGHAAFVSAIRPVTNAAGQTVQYVVEYIEDTNQGDNIASNNVRTMTVNLNGVDTSSPLTVSNRGIVGFFFENVVAVPEPSVLGLIIIGATIANLMRGRSRK